MPGLNVPKADRLKLEPFVVRIELVSPVVPGRRLHFDALLANIIFERTGDLEAAHTTLPLARADSVWAASAALLEGPCAVIDDTIVRSLRPRFDLDPSKIAPTGKRYPSMDTTRGPYQNLLVDQLAYEAAAVWFTGVGDIEHIEALLAGLPAIGKKRSAGRGAIRFVETEPPHAVIEVQPIRHRQAGIAFTDGTPARAIPAAEWRGNATVEIAAERCVPPYWNGPVVTCAVPQHLVVDRDTAELLTGCR